MPRVPYYRAPDGTYYFAVDLNDPAPIWEQATRLYQTAATYGSVVPTPTVTAVTSTVGTYIPAYFNYEQDQWIMDDATYLRLSSQRVLSSREYTARQHREIQERLERADRDRREAERQHRQALIKAREFLLSVLDEAQRQMFHIHGYFEVIGSMSRSRYRIKSTTYTGNVELMENDSVVARFCAHCQGNVPLYDHLVAQKLVIECDESEFRRVANRH